MERYERILVLSKKMIQENCPIIFEKGALLKDYKFNKNVLQLQFKNIGIKQIKAVYLSVDCMDVEKILLETVEKKYLDLAIKYDDAFGANLPIELTNDFSRNFDFCISKVVFNDDTVYDFSGKMIDIKEAGALTKLGELEEQFKRELSKLNQITKCIVTPTEFKSSWYCTCGALNHSSNNKCGNCGIERINLFAISDMDYLGKKHKEYIYEKECEAKIKKQQEIQDAENLRIRLEETQRKREKIRKKFVIAVVILIVVGAFWGAASKKIVPALKYSSALNAIENSNYEKAYQLLSELGEYKDSMQKILEAKYKEACEGILSGEYEKTILLFEELGEYKDSEEKILEAKYKQAIKYVEDRDFRDGYILFSELNGYEDSETRYIEAKYNYAAQSLAQNNYAEAIRIFGTISDYKDSAEKVLEAKYQRAKAYIGYNDYESALDLLKELSGYLDSDELYKEVSYKYGMDLARQGYGYQAIEYLKAGEASEEEILEVKYEHISKNFYSHHTVTYVFMCDLVKANYKDSKQLFDYLYTENDIKELEAYISANGV